MADLINLNRFRKEKARADKAAKADENRVRFGRTKAEKQAAQREAEIETQRLEGHRREPSPPDEKP